MNLTNLNSNKDRDGIKRKPPVDLSTMVYGKVPPQAKDLEEIVLGAIMLEKDAFEKTTEFLRPECFYLDNHQRVYRAMHSLAARNQPIDIFTVVDALKTTQELETVGGAYYVNKLTNAVVSAANIASHCRIIFQKFVSREIIRISGEAIGEAYDDGDAFEMLENLEQQISQLALQQSGKKFQTLGEVAKESVDRIHAAKESGNEMTGVSSGLPELDGITQGWQRTNFIILAARPGVGKSAVAGNLAMNAATHPDKRTPVGIFSLEMSAGQWGDRLLSGATRIPLHNLKRGRVDDNEMKRLQQAALVDFPTMPIYFDDSPNMSIYQLKRKLRVLVLRFNVGLAIVDYLQLMSGDRKKGENREQEVSRISRELKQLAKELNIPIIALSQLSRAGDSGEPQLSHLRESGAIEQDADDVFFLYPVDEYEQAADASLKDSILLIIAKHRNGILGKIPIKFVKSIQKLMDEREYNRYMTGMLPLKDVTSGRLPYADKDTPF